MSTGTGYAEARNGQGDDGPPDDGMSESTELVPESSFAALEAQTRGEIDVQVATAKRYPRSLTRFKARAVEMATISKEIAASCHYSLKRGGNTIEGPSVRMAEIAVASYGNVHAAARVVRETEKMITVQAACWDLENNSRSIVEYSRRITYANGKRYNDDMITTATNDAISRAYRNAVFKTIPRALIEPIYQAALKCAFGDEKSLPVRRKETLDHFAGLGVRKEEVYAFLGIEGWDDLNLAHIRTLGGLANAIRDGETTAEEQFRPARDAAPAEASAPPASKGDRLAEELKAAAKGRERPKPSAAAPDAKPADLGWVHGGGGGNKPEPPEPGSGG